MYHAGALIRWWSIIPRWYFEAERSSLSSTYDLSSSEGSLEVFEDFGFDRGRWLLSFEHETLMEDCTLDALLESVKWRRFAPRDSAGLLAWNSMASPPLINALLYYFITFII